MPTEAVKSLVIGIVLNCTPIGGPVEFWFRCSLGGSQLVYILLKPTSPVRGCALLAVILQLIAKED